MKKVVLAAIMAVLFAVPALAQGQAASKATLAAESAAGKVQVAQGPAASAANFAGTWVGKTETGRTEITLRVNPDGTAVIETKGAVRDSSPANITVDGNKILVSYPAGKGNFTLKDGVLDGMMAYPGYPPTGATLKKQ